MSTTYRTIDTHYGGFKFRSRGEARWAVFFDTLGVPFEYEPDGYLLDGLQYLPDFYLPKQDCFFEVKGMDGEHDEGREKALLLAAATGKPVFIFRDVEPLTPVYEPGCYIPESYIGSGTVHLPNGEMESGWEWFVCGCGAKGIGYLGSHTLREVGGSADRAGGPGLCSDLKSERLVKAYRKAKQARFEFGQNPRRWS